MPLPLEQYGLIGDFQTAALVGADGSIDWLCLPRFDSGACFAALLGSDENGHWRIAPRAEKPKTTRRYREGTLILETLFETAEGAVRLVDFMPPRAHQPEIVRIVEGVRGRVPMSMKLVLRFDYGWIVPWVHRKGDEIVVLAGSDEMVLRSPVETRGENLSTLAEFEIEEGQSLEFILGWHPAEVEEPHLRKPGEALAQTQAMWESWSAQCKYDREYKEIVLRSLITLKALTYAPTGGIVAAPTTSLPEAIAGPRNWDYRYCWIRDATFTLYALSVGGYVEEATAWRNWLLRAVAGAPDQLQIMYSVVGERRLTEITLDWLPGYLDSRPVRIGNAASKQFQLDVYGEVMDAMHVARRSGVERSEHAWNLQRALMGHLEKKWREPDEGIWEVRGGPQHFTHSKVMAWVAVDRAVKAVERMGEEGPIDRWKQLRAEIHDTVCREGYDPDVGAFTQAFGSKHLDASVLMIPLVGFLPPTDERVRNTVATIEKNLTRDGYVLRYDTHRSLSEGLPPGEGAFLPCSFWLVDNLALIGEHERAKAMFERLMGLCNDVGLISEEYDPTRRCLLGNFPQAFTHVGIVNSAANLSRRKGPARHRAERD
jgi:GH15 family glucan-1,4-alpha-glucosidase